MALKTRPGVATPGPAEDRTGSRRTGQGPETDAAHPHFEPAAPRARSAVAWRRRVYTMVGSALLTSACTASGADVAAVTFGGGLDPSPRDEGETDTDVGFPRLSEGDPTVGDGDGATTGGEAPPTDSGESSGEDSTSGPAVECTPGETRECYDGPTGTRDVGPCRAGTSVCLGDGTWSDCDDAIVPIEEVCNEVDDDCDGVVDDGDPGGGAACTTALLGPCSAGNLACTDGAVVCTPTQEPAASETCGNDVDDDCNGLIDDTCTSSDCDPMDPAALCGADQHCIPSSTGQTDCLGPTGPGGQYATCLSDAQCGPGFACVETGFGSTYCMRWCTGDLDCPIISDQCTTLSPSMLAGVQEYGVCYDGLP